MVLLAVICSVVAIISSLAALYFVCRVHHQIEGRLEGASKRMEDYALQELLSDCTSGELSSARGILGVYRITKEQKFIVVGSRELIFSCYRLILFLSKCDSVARRLSDTKIKPLKESEGYKTSAHKEVAQYLDGHLKSIYSDVAMVLDDLPAIFDDADTRDRLKNIANSFNLSD